MLRPNFFGAKLLTIIMLSGAVTMFASSCDDDEGGSGTNARSSISGIINDTQGSPLEGVSVTLKETDSKREVEATATSASDGSFSFGEVPATAQFLTFEKEGYSTVGITVSEKDLLAGPVTLNPVLEYANASIRGRILDAQNGNAPLEGVTVSIGVKTMKTGSDGTFAFEGLTLQSYVLTCAKAGCASFTKNLGIEMFVDGVIVVDDIVMGGKELLRGLTLQDLKDAPAWYYNEYRGGYGRGGGRVDWSTSFMSALISNWVGNWEMQNEGCTLRIRNSGDEQMNPADLVNFDTFTYGRKFIDENNQTMSVYARCHQATNEEPVKWGVQVIDLSSADPTVDLIGGVQEHPSGDYKTFTFDLSPYIGKEVIVAVGHFRAKTGDYWNQFCLGHISFAPAETKGDDYLPGSEIEGLEGWNITKENIESIMPNTRKDFIGYSLSGLNIQRKSNPAYHDWAGTGHIASEWAFQYVSKDIEPTPSEGILIKTRNGADADYKVPESFFYAKFSMAPGHDKVVLNVRNFSSDPTTFKFTAIENDGTAHFIDPVENTAVTAEKTENGCWNFTNEKGGQDTPDDYAHFTYDLSAFDGKDVTICVGIHKGPAAGGEQKLCFHSINIR